MMALGPKELAEIRKLQSEHEEREATKRLPGWVKCASCGERPRWGDLLIEIVPNSSALIHSSCAASQGKIAGINVGTNGNR